MGQESDREYGIGFVSAPSCLGPPVGRPEASSHLTAGGWNRLEASLPAYLVVDAGWDLSCAVIWNSCLWCLSVGLLELPHSMAAEFQE